MGLQLAAIHFDEIAFINYNWIIVPTATNSMLAAAEQSRKAGIPAPIIYTTTAGNPDTRMGRYALDIFEAACPFNEKFYDFKDRDEMLEIVRKNSLHPERPMLYLEFSYRQLGKTDAWFRAAAAKMGANKDDIARDLLNIWQASTDKAVLSPEMIEKIRNSKRTPSHTEIADGFIINWYVDESIVSTDRFQRRPLVMGMDTSENVGRDYTTFTIIDPSTMNLVATCRCNETNLMQIGRQVFQMLEKYTGLVFIPERNNTGIAIIDFVIEELQKHHINPFFRIYNEVIQNYDDPKYKNIDVYNYSEIFGRVRSSFGFRTSGSATSTQGSRNLLFKTVMMKALEMNSSRIFDRQLINEFCTLEVRNGRIDHPEGGHDDQVVSFLLACYLIYFGRNLQMYGIPLNTVLSDVTIAGATVDPAVRQEQVEYKKRIAELEDLINRSPNFLLKQSYLRELSNLQSLVDDEIVTVQPMAVSQVKAQEQEIQKPNEGMNNLRNFVGALRRFNQPMRMPDNSRSHML